MKAILISVLLVHFALFPNKTCDSLQVFSGIKKSVTKCHNNVSCENKLVKDCIQCCYLKADNGYKENIKLFKELDLRYFFSVIENEPQLRNRPPIKFLS